MAEGTRSANRVADETPRSNLARVRARVRRRRLAGRAGVWNELSSVPVIVYQFSPLEYRPKGGPPGKDWSDCPGSRDGGVGCLSFSNDASLLLPTPALTGTYRITGQKGLTLFSQGIGFPVAGPYFAVTATADDTHVNVNLSPTARVMASARNEIPYTNGGGTMSVTLNAGDVAEIIGATGDTSDFSGSLVVADKPVQVISGAPCQQQPPDKAACDHIEESVFPAETLGQHYVVMVPTGPKAAVVGHIVRMYGNIDDTRLTYIPASAKPSGCPTRLQAGQIVDCGIVDHDFEVKGDHEFAVGSFMLAGELLDKQGALGDPSQSLVVPVDQFRTQYAFLAPDDYAANYVDVVAPTGTDVLIDGKPPVRPFAPLAGTAFSLARIPLSAGKSGAHTLSANAQVGIQVIGYGASTSYYYPGGLNLGQLAAPPPH